MLSKTNGLSVRGWAFATVLVATLLGLTFLYWPEVRWEDKKPPSAQVGVGYVTQVPASPVQSPVGSPTNGSAAVVVGQSAIAPIVGARLVREYFTATNMSAFVENAKLHAKDGGIYMARKAVALCADSQKDWGGDKIVQARSAAQAKAITAFQARCEGLAQSAEGFSDPFGFMEDLDQFGADKDPLRMAEKRLMAGRFKDDGTVDLKKELSTLLAYGGVVPHFDDLSTLSGRGQVHYLNGKAYIGADEEALLGAWIAYSIEKSMIASSDEFGGNLALSLCARSGVSCEGSALDRVSAQFASKDQVQRIREIYPILKEALDSANAGAFGPLAR